MSRSEAETKCLLCAGESLQDYQEQQAKHMHRCKLACKWVGGKLAQWEGMLQLDNIEKQAGWSKRVKLGSEAPTGKH